jgi:phosphoglycerate dehydrogenase-like enzyme
MKPGDMKETLMQAPVSDPWLNVHRSGYTRDGFAARYDASRPTPPPALLDLLCQSIQTPAPPVTPETHGLIGEKQLHSMEPTAVLVNVSRAEIIDEEALYRALAERIIAGAALAVWYRYPTAAGPTLPARQPFHELANVLMTPHVSGWTDGMLAARAKRIAENIHRVARREPPVHLIPAAAE